MLGCSGEPEVPCQGSGTWSKGCNVTTVHVAGCWGAAGWLLGTWRSPVRDPHPSVSEDAAHIDQRFPFSDPSGDSDLGPTPLPCTRREGAEPCPAGGAREAVGRDPQPWAPGWTLGSAAASRGSWGGMRGMEHTPSSPTSPPQKAHQYFPLIGIFFPWGEIRSFAATCLLVSCASAKEQSLVWWGCIAPLATETVESKSFGSSKSLKICHIFMCVLLPLFTLFLCLTQACSAPDSSPGPRCGEKTWRCWGPPGSLLSHCGDLICHQHTGVALARLGGVRLGT